MTGIGQAAGAGTIVNAMATGRGVAFGLDLSVVVTVAPAKRWSVVSAGKRLGPRAALLAIESARRVTTTPLRIEVTTNIPPERGLKSSSAVSVATIRACLNHTRRRWTDAKILSAAADAGLRSGTSLTGAYDDAAACLLGGIVFTDNRKRRLTARRPLPRGLVALVHLGAHRLPTARVKGTDFEPVRAIVHDAERLARAGDMRSAMLLNTAAYAPLFRHDARFTFAMLHAGAYAAGLSGKGPAEIALLTPRQAAHLRRRWPNSLIVRVRNRRAP